jgi:hypothetical protein
MTRPIPLLAVIGLIAMAAAPAQAGQALPAPMAMPSAILAPRDLPYPGTISLSVDATDLVHHVMAVHETIPVAGAGDLVLHYPKWIPGNHGPTGAIELLGGLTAHAGASALDWKRDPVDAYAFHVPVPAGVGRIDLDYQFLSPLLEAQGRVVMTPEMLDLQWDSVVLYRRAISRATSRSTRRCACRRAGTTAPPWKRRTLHLARPYASAPYRSTRCSTARSMPDAISSASTSIRAAGFRCISTSWPTSPPSSP